jgi:predicted RNA-binding Zn ribbon-like protein
VLHEPADLSEWLAAGPLGVGSLPASPRDLALARELREALWHLFQAAAGDERLGATWLGALNATAARPGLQARLLAPGRRVWHRATTACALATIAASAVELLGGDDADRVRRCAGERCWLLYLDTSPAGRRRWCSMERCGNRAKVRSHRARRGNE